MQPHERIKHPLKLQDTMGNGRVCEWQTLAKVAEQIEAVAYCSIGADEGMGSLAIKENYHAMPHLIVTDASEDSLMLIQAFCDLNPGRMLFYVNDRQKLDSLKALSKLVRSGSVIGVHDWGIDKMTIAGTYTEIPESRCGFLYNADFEVYAGAKDWITRNKCVQKFWVKK